MKKTLSILCIILVMFYAMVSSVFANNTPIAVDTAQDAIENFVAAMDEQDWNTYLQLLPEDQKDDMEYFLLDNNNITEHLGVLNIVSAQIDSINEIPAGVTVDPSEKHFLVGIIFDVYSDTVFSYDGLSYFYVTTVMENDSWKIKAIPRATESQIKSIFNDPIGETAHAIDVIKWRERGVWVNNSNKILQIDSTSPVRMNYSVNDTLSASAASLLATTETDDQFTRPDTLMVWMASRDNPVALEVDFYDYCKSVLYNEWGVNNLSTGEPHPMAALEAGAQCVKMRAWYNYHNTSTWTHNCHVSNTVDGNYQVGYEHERSTQAVNNVGGIGIKNYSGDVMNTYYYAGSYSSAGTEHGGNCSQLGSVYLAKNNPDYTWEDIIHYYFDYASNVCPGGPCSWFEY